MTTKKCKIGHVCMTEIRQRNGALTGLCSMCKAKVEFSELKLKFLDQKYFLIIDQSFHLWKAEDACEVQKSQNFWPGGNQCRPGRNQRGPSGKISKLTPNHPEWPHMTFIFIIIDEHWTYKWYTVYHIPFIWWRGPHESL